MLAADGAGGSRRLAERRNLYGPGAGMVVPARTEGLCADQALAA